MIILAMTAIFLAVATTITTITTFIFKAFIAHVVTQRRACAAAGSRANQAACIAAHAAADHVTACRTQTAANGGFCTVMAICTHCTARCAADACANR